VRQSRVPVTRFQSKCPPAHEISLPRLLFFQGLFCLYGKRAGGLDKGVSFSGKSLLLSFYVYRELRDRQRPVLALPPNPPSTPVLLCGLAVPH